MAQSPFAEPSQEPASHIAVANPAVLLASLVGITGETGRIERFAPHFTYDYNGGITAVLPPEIREELNSWALDVLSDLGAHQRNPLEVDDSAFLALAEALVGWPSAHGSLDFLREQGGFTSFLRAKPHTTRPPEDFKLAIIGAGMAGISLAVAAKKTGIDFEVLEKRAGVGGVWWQNRYPGVGVDTPSRYYSFSFEINRDWTHTHPPGAEFREYLQRVAEKYGVLEKFTFGAEVTQLTWDQRRQEWQIEYATAGGLVRTTANAVVTAAGYLTNPKLPDVPGLESFAGRWFHSAEWDPDYDFQGKRVGVVGTGCTSVQVVDALADRMGSLTLFQRQPHWVFPPTPVTHLPPGERWLLRNVPAYAHWARLHTFLVIGDVNYAAVRYDAEWASGHEHSISEANDVMRKVAVQYLDEHFADRPALRAKLTPDFAVMGKRPVKDPGAYFATVKKPTSTVVTSGLGRVVPEGIVDGDGVLHELDVIVYATGFTLEYLSNWTIAGRDGRKLSEVWQESPKAYNSCQVPGFPNLFITSGPHANPSHGGGHNFTVEATTHYVIECIQTLLETGKASVDVTPEAFERWEREVNESMADSVWARETRATTYYRNSKGEVILASPFTLEEFWNRLRGPKLEDLVLE